MELNNRCLGEEKISKLLFKFAVPCVVGMLISALYNIVDQMFIGNSELGFYGNAATGVCFPIICIINAFAWCIGDGAAAFLSISAGRKDEESAHKCVGTGIVVTVIISVLLSALSVIFAKPLLTLFGASDKTLGLATDYFVIISSCFIFYLLLNVLNSMIRADGAPGYAMLAMLLGAVVNICLDPLFIFVCKWGIKGAAWATVIGQIVSFVMCALYFRRPRFFRLQKRSFVPDIRILGNVVSLGTSTFITQIAVALVSVVSNIVLSHYGALSIYGKDITISVFSIVIKVYTLVSSVSVGVVLGGQPIFGYNYGAGRMDRVKQTYKTVLLTTLTVGLLATLVLQLKPQWIIRIFGTGETLYMEFAVKAFRRYLALMTGTCLVTMTAIFFQSIGKSVHAAVASLTRDIVCFVPLVLIVSNVLELKQAGAGINGILIAAPIADCIAVSVALLLTVSFFRKTQTDLK